MNRFVTSSIMASLIAAPASAAVRDAAFASSSDRMPTQASVFAGATYSVALNRGSKGAQGYASLRLSGMTRSWNGARLQVGQGAELRLGAQGRPMLLAGGQEIDQLKRRSNLSGGTVAVIVVGVLAVGAAAAYFALRDPCDHKQCE
jgi:hypothetical protein